MKKSPNTGDVSLPAAQSAGSGRKMGGDEAHVTKKLILGTAKWLAKPSEGRKIATTNEKPQYDPMDNNSNGKSRMKGLSYDGHRAGCPESATGRWRHVYGALIAVVFAVLATTSGFAQNSVTFGTDKFYAYNFIGSGNLLSNTNYYLGDDSTTIPEAGNLPIFIGPLQVIQGGTVTNVDPYGIGTVVGGTTVDYVEPTGTAVLSSDLTSAYLMMVSWDGTSALTINDGATYTVQTAIIGLPIQNAYVPTRPIQPTTLNLDNGNLAGNLIIGSEYEGDLSITAPSQGSGLLNVTGVSSTSSLTIAQGSGSIGSVNLNASSVLNVNSGLAIGAGTASISGTGTMAVSGSIALGGTVTVAAGSTVQLNGNQTFSGTGTISGGKVLWQGGYLSGNATINADNFLINTAGASSNSPMTYEMNALNTGGTTTLEGGQYLTSDGGTWNNSGVINFVDDDTDVVAANEYTAWNNTGTIEKTGGTGLSFVQAVLDNEASGTIIAQTGTLAFSVSGTNSGTITAASGASVGFSSGLALNNGSQITGSGTVTMSGYDLINGTTTLAAGSTLQLTGNSTISGTGTISGGTLLWQDGSLSASGTLDASNWVINTATATGNSAMMIALQTFATTGTTTIKGGNTLLSDGGTWNNGGTINFADDTDISAAYNYSAWNNTGTVQKTGGTGASYVQVNFNNEAGGTVLAQTGTLGFSADATNSGTVTVASNATVGFYNGLTLENGSQITGAGTVAVSGSDSLNGKTTLAAGSTLQFTGNNSLSGTGTFSGGKVLWQDSTLTVNGTFGLGNLLINTANAPSSSPMMIQMGTFNTTGTATIKGGNTLLSDGGTWNNGGTIDLADDTDISAAYAFSIWSNSGTIAKTGGTGASYIQVTLSNQATGTVLAESGTLAFSSTAINSGTIGASSGADLSFANGFTSNDGAQITGSGTVTLTGSETFNGTTTVAAGSTLQLTGTNSLSGTGTISGGTVLWKDGMLTGSASINANNFVINTANSTPTGSGLMFLNVSTLNTGGTTTFEGGGVINTNVGTGPVWNNSGTIKFADDTSIIDGGATGTLNNTGTIEKTGGTGTSSIAMQVNNESSAIVSVQTGTLEFDLNVINSGQVNVSSGGTAQFDANLTNSGQLNVASAGKLNVSGTFTEEAGGTVSGNGTINATSNVSGTVAAGSNGLTFDGNLTLASGSTLQFDLGTLNVQGNVNLDNVNLELNSALATMGMAKGTQLDLLTYSGTETGELYYNGVALANGSTITFGLNTFQINYAVGDPSVVLTAQSDTVPEPSTYVLLIGGCGLLMFLRRPRAKA